MTMRMACSGPGIPGIQGQHDPCSLAGGALDAQVSAKDCCPFTDASQSESADRARRRKAAPVVADHELDALAVHMERHLNAVGAGMPDDVGQ